MKKKVLYSSLIGLKITDVQKDPYSSNSFDATLSNGMKLHFWKQLITIPKAPKSEQQPKEITLRNYIKSLGVDVEFVDKRKTMGWRLKCDVYSKGRFKVMKAACDAINALMCTKCTITAEIETYVGGRYYNIPNCKRLIVRTSIAPSNIIIS